MLSRDQYASNPLVISIALEMIARNLRRKASASSSLERSEYARRDREILWYLFRGDIWRSFTRYLFRLDYQACKQSDPRILAPNWMR